MDGEASTADPRMYIRIIADVRRRIETGRLAPRRPAPTIGTLLADHRCGRQTVSKALQMLEADGYLIRYPAWATT